MTSPSSHATHVWCWIATTVVSTEGRTIATSAHVRARARVATGSATMVGRTRIVTATAMMTMATMATMTTMTVGNEGVPTTHQAAVRRRVGKRVKTGTGRCGSQRAASACARRKTRPRAHPASSLAACATISGLSALVSLRFRSVLGPTSTVFCSDTSGMIVWRLEGLNCKVDLRGSTIGGLALRGCTVGGLALRDGPIG
jgi:hypothetical protein